MAATPETKFKETIKRRLAEILKRRNLPAKLVWNAGAGYGVATLDLTGVIAGHPIAIEVKRPDGEGKLTARQKSDIRDYAECGAFTMVIDDEHSLSVFLAWVEVLEPRNSCIPHVIQALMDGR